MWLHHLTPNENLKLKSKAEFSEPTLLVKDEVHEWQKYGFKALTNFFKSNDINLTTKFHVMYN